MDKNILDLQVERSDFALLLNECRKSNKLTDVELDVGGKLFPAHRAVLSLYSPVLEAAVSDQWSSSKICPISDEYVDPTIVEPLLHFLYTGSIQLTPDNVHSICVAAHFLQITTLFDPSLKHLCQLITLENVLELFEFSLICQLEPLRYSCLRVISRDPEKVFKDPAILEFSSRSFNDLIGGLKGQNRPETTLREIIFDCIVRWTEVNLSERLDELPGLLKDVPLEELPFKFLTQTVSKHRLVKESFPCIELVSAALASSRPGKSENLMVFGTEEKPYRQLILCYDSQTKAWKKLPDMHESRSDFGVTVVNRKDIVICGGSPNGGSSKMLASVEMFEWSTQTWKSLPAMPEPIMNCSAAVLNGLLYVIGTDGEKLSKTVMCYSFESRKWKYVKSMNYGRINAQLIEYDGYLYAFGNHYDSTERYDPAFDEWTFVEEKMTTNKGFYISRFGEINTVAIHQGKVITRGDYFDEFVPGTNDHTQHPKPTFGGGLASLNGQLLLAREDTKWIYKYSLSSRKWTKFFEMESVLEDVIMVTGAFY